MTYLQDLFDNRLTRIGAAVFLVMLAIVLVNLLVDLPYQAPLLGLLTLSLVPVLFIVVAVIFIIAILKS